MNDNWISEIKELAYLRKAKIKLFIALLFPFPNFILSSSSFIVPSQRIKLKQLDAFCLANFWIQIKSSPRKELLIDEVGVVKFQPRQNRFRVSSFFFLSFRVKC